MEKALTMAISELGRTFRGVRRFKVVLAYLGAYLLFNDGVQTTIAIAGAFAADIIGIPLAFNMATILIIQFVAAGGARVFAWLARLTTTKTALTVSLVGWVVIVIGGVAVVPLVPASHGEFDYQLSIVRTRQPTPSTSCRTWETPAPNRCGGARATL